MSSAKLTHKSFKIIEVSQMTSTIIHYTKDELKQISNLELSSIISSIKVYPSRLTEYLTNHYPLVLEELIFRTKFLDEYYGDKFVPIKARLYCIDNNLQSQPKCEHPKCTNKVPWKQGANKFKSHCCKKCSDDDPKVKRKREQTNIDVHGCKCNLQSEECKIKTIKTCNERWGCDHPMQSEEVKQTYRQNCIERLGVDNPMKLDENKQKVFQTTYKNHGVFHPMQAKAIMDKIKTTIISNNGGMGFQSKQIQEKATATMEKNLGVSHPMLSEKVKLKVKATNIERRGVDNPWKCNEVKEKIVKTMITHHGVEHYAQSPEFHKKCHKPYTNPKYPNMSWATSWEFKVYDFLTEHDIPFEYQPSISLPYEYKETHHTYHPDFLVNGRIYEVKGDHFFRINEETGKEEMYCPYRYSDWSDEEYEWKCGKEEAKHQCMIANDVVILRKKEIDSLTVDMFLL